MFDRLAFVALSLSLLPASESHCHGSRNGYRAGSIGDLVQNDKVLLGHVFATFFVRNFSHCFTKCEDSCRCRSFNLPVSGEGECELNNADNSTALTKPRRGWRYHHLEMTELRRGASTCYEPYENGCCANNPCRNGTDCVEIPDHGKPTFNCTCTTGYLGPSCNRKIQSCFDYLWNDKGAASGYYYVWDTNNNRYTVFCDMQPEQFEAWTLIMSYDQTVASTYQSKPFFIDAPSPSQNTLTDYRLSLDRMKIVREAMEAGRELEWKATCDYSFTDGQSTSSETVRSHFDTLDIMKFTTNANSVVGHYPFTSKTSYTDMSGFGNHASFHGVQYEAGPLGDLSGSVRMTGASDSYIELHDNSNKLDTCYSITIMLQVYPYGESYGQLLGWGLAHEFGVHLWSFGTDIFFRTIERLPETGDVVTRVPGQGINMWNYVAVTYDYENNLQSVYLNGTLLKRVDASSIGKLATNSYYQLLIGVKLNDDRYFNGRVACMRIFSLALTEEEVKREMEDWRCPQEHESSCHRVDYINIRGKECYNCNVWATQTNTETFTVNAHRGDQDDGCNFKSGSTVTDENIFGVYKAKDPATHTCAATADSTTQYWFGGKL